MQTLAKQITCRSGGITELTPLQNMFVKSYFKCDGNMLCIARGLDRSEQHVYQIAKAQVVQDAIEKETQKRGPLPERPKVVFTVAKQDRVRLLWKVANQGAEMIYDKEGNEVMSNPATTVSAIRTINDMLPGSLAPKELDVNVTVEDRRTEAEIADNISLLMQKYTALKDVTDEQVIESRALPTIDVGDISDET